MNNNWPTKYKDIFIAEQIMEDYATQSEAESIGLFELVVNSKEKSLNLRLSSWVLTVAERFKTIYGAIQGDVVTRKVISNCLTKGHTLH